MELGRHRRSPRPPPFNRDHLGAPYAWHRVSALAGPAERLAPAYHPGDRRFPLSPDVSATRRLAVGLHVGAMGMEMERRGNRGGSRRRRPYTGR